MSTSITLKSKNIKETYKVTITDLYDDVFELKFTKNQYPNLRALIAEYYPEEFGECKGRGLCGTCHIIATSGTLREPIEYKEVKTLKSKCDSSRNSRLACQILLDKQIHQMNFQYIGDD